MKKLRYAIVVLLVIIDQYVKYLVRTNMNIGESNDIISNIFSLTFVRNTGAAFGSLKGQIFMLKFLPIIIVIALIIFLEKMIKDHWTFIISMILIISGGIGNLIDRWFFGYVTDMFDFHFWPVFNMADIYVCVGCGFLILYVLFFDKKKKIDG